MAAKTLDRKLARAVTGLLVPLLGGEQIEHCSKCRNLAFAFPDFGPNVAAAVCKDHVPARCALIRSPEDVTKALRKVFAALEPYGIHFDPNTGEQR